MKEAKVGRPGGNIVAHRMPERGIRRIVVHHHYLEGRIVERFETAQGGNHHRGRLIATSQVHRDEGLARPGRQRAGSEAPLQAAVPKQLGKFEQVREQNHHHHKRGRYQQRQHQPVTGAQVLQQRQGHQHRRKRQHRLSGDRKGAAGERAQIGHARKKPDQQHKGGE